MRTVSIDVAGAAEAFELDFDERRWQSARTLSENLFPLVAEVDGKRYELYSDNTFAEEEL
jgi:hypothetical protein